MKALENQLIINNTDVYKSFGVFLTEEKRGGRENLTALLAPSKAKSHVGVNIRENNGTKYAARLEPRNEERDVTLHFALIADTREQWMENYRAFINFLKGGNNGWLTVTVPTLKLTMRMFYVDSSAFKPLTYLYKDGVHASRFKVRFREPQPAF